MRDLDRVREKIEIRLEPRQVILLAVGTMLFSGALFAAGFVVGQRQGAHAPVRVVADDLARLDAEARAPRDAPDAPGTPVALGEVEFLFPSVLGSRPARPRKPAPKVRLPEAVVKAEAERKEAVERQAAARKEAEAAATRAADERARQEAVEAAARLAALAEAEAAAAAAAAEEQARKDAEEAAAMEAARIAAELAAAEAEAARKAAEEAAAAEEQGRKDAEAAARAKAEAEAAVVAAAPDEAEEDEPERPKSSAGASERQHRYTLQVKATKEKDDADRFIATLRQAGFEPHTVLADIPGKGRYYRVRIGRFDSLEDARAFQRSYKARSGQADGGFITDL